ncbi:MAG: hypothetical protein QM796_02240 [Chthoniobacteraceae bacterium]
MRKPRPKKSASKKFTFESPLDAKKRAIQDQERALHEKVQRAQQFIDDAPRKQEELEKRRREELISRSSKNLRRVDATTLLDRRNYEHRLNSTFAIGRPRVLKYEKKQARMKFFTLCFVLALILLWLCLKFVL